ncbi:hypothetical protein N7G274_001343 [Stereocaulon virgatum]|uniref:Uncharacterized protein n=1 Tax=Stereocaulon virgatum TaxID=373712 RepID=A0ABR4ANK4_9LECA
MLQISPWDAIVLAIRRYSQFNPTLEVVRQHEGPMDEAVDQRAISMTHILSATNWEMWGELVDLSPHDPLSLWLWGSPKARAQNTQLSHSLRCGVTSDSATSRTHATVMVQSAHLRPSWRIPEESFELLCDRVSVRELFS